MLEVYKTYKFHFERTIINKKGETMLLLRLYDEPNGKTYVTFPLKCQISENIPDEIYCRVLSIDEQGNTRLNQCEYQYLSNVYDPEKFYDFTVTSQITNSKKGDNRFLIESNLGLQHLYTDYNKTNITVGDKFQAKVKVQQDNTQDSAFLYFNIKFDEELGIFEPESVFEKSGHKEDYEKLFLNIDQFNIESDKYTEYINDMRDKLKDNNRLWLFDYINVLFFQFVSIDIEDIDKKYKINNLIKDIEIWMLEESGILSKFGPEKRNETIQKSLLVIDRAKAVSEAIRIIKDNQQEKFLSDILTKLRRSLYIRDREHVFSVMYNLVTLDKDFISQNMIAFSEIIDFSCHEITDTYILERIVSTLSHTILSDKKELNKKFHYLRNDDTDKSTLINMIVGIGTLLNFHSIKGLERNNEYGIKPNQLFPEMCKYLSYLTTDDKALLLINKSLEWVLSKNEAVKIPGKTLRNIENDPDLLVEYICKMYIEPLNNTRCHFNGNVYTQYFDGNISVSYTKENININNIKYSLYDLYNLQGTTLNVVSINKTTKWEQSENLLYYRDKWKEFLINTAPDKISGTHKKEDERVCIRTKEINDKYPKLIFCTRDNSIIKEDGVISPIDCYPNFWMENLCDIFTSDLHFVAEIKHQDNGHINYDITKNIIEYSNYMAENTNKPVNGICLNLNGKQNKATFITDNGIICETFLDYREHIKEDELYLLDVDLSDNEHYPIGIIRSKSYAIMDKNEMLKQQLIKISEYNKDTNHIEENHDLEMPYIHLIIDNYIRLFQDKVLRYNLYQIARLIALQERSTLSNYYSSCIQYMEMTESFIENVPIVYSIPDFDWDDNILSLFPTLRNHTEMYNLLKNFGSENDIEYLYNLATSSTVNDQINRFAKLSLAASLIESVSDDERPISYLRGIVAEEFGGESDKRPAILDVTMDVDKINSVEDDVNFGTENQFVEFKTSIAFEAGNPEHKENLDGQMFVILKVIDGLLNAKGGTLYIGIKDNGTPCGINKDLEALNCNIDKYERIIRGYIVHEFNKDVNGTIEISFPLITGNNICKIVVPPYIIPQALRGDFYQRQGNETRIIKGNDLVMLIRRKVEGKDTIIADSNIKEENGPLEKEESKESTVSENTINSELVRKNDNAKGFELTFYSDGTYIIGKNTPKNDNIANIIINKNMKNMYILQCYDNGCINKMPIRNFFNMKAGYKYHNGINRDSYLKQLLILSDKDYVVLVCSQGYEDYVKIVAVSDITAHTTLGLRGNQLITQTYDVVKGWYMLTEDEVKNVSRLITSTRTNLGWRMSSSSYASEISWLKQNIIANNDIMGEVSEKKDSTMTDLLHSGEFTQIANFLDEYVQKGSTIVKARKIIQKLIVECNNSEEFWMLIKTCFNCNISVFRKPITETILENNIAEKFIPKNEIFEQIVKQLFTFDQKFSQSIEFVYPFRQYLSSSSKLYIYERTHDLSQPDDYEKLFEITGIDKERATKILLEDNTTVSLYALFELLENISNKNNNSSILSFVFSCRNKIIIDNISNKLIRDFISVFILKTKPEFFNENTIIKLKEGGFEAFYNACLAKNNKDKIQEARNNIEENIGKIINGKIVRDYKHHYLLEHRDGVMILLQHSWAANKHYVNDVVSVKIVSANKQYGTLFGTEKDDTYDLPDKEPLLQTGEFIELSFIEYQGKYVPLAKGIYSRIHVRVITYPADFNYKKHYTAIVVRKNNLFEYDVRIVSEKM